MKTSQIAPRETFSEHHHVLAGLLALIVLVLVGILVGQVLGSVAVHVAEAFLGVVGAGA